MSYPEVSHPTETRPNHEVHFARQPLFKQLWVRVQNYIRTVLSLEGGQVQQIQRERDKDLYHYRFLLNK